jgi:hypothetical protein
MSHEDFRRRLAELLERARNAAPSLPVPADESGGGGPATHWQERAEERTRVLHAAERE